MHYTTSSPSFIISHLDYAIIGSDFLFQPLIPNILFSTLFQSYSNPVYIKTLLLRGCLQPSSDSQLSCQCPYHRLYDLAPYFCPYCLLSGFSFEIVRHDLTCGPLHSPSSLHLAWISACQKIILILVFAETVFFSSLTWLFKISACPLELPISLLCFIFLHSHYQLQIYERVYFTHCFPFGTRILLGQKLFVCLVEQNLQHLVSLFHITDTQLVFGKWMNEWLVDLDKT